MSTIAPEQAPGGATFTLSSAAAATGISKRTLLRKIDQLAEHGATQLPDGTWSIPLKALFAIGANPGKPRTGDSADIAPEHAPEQKEEGTGGTGARTAPAKDDLVELRVRAEVAEARLDAQARILAERDRLISSLELSQRQLIAAKPAGELEARLDALQASLQELAVRNENTTATPAWLLPLLLAAAMVVCTVLLIVFLR